MSPTVKPVIKSFHCADVYNLESYKPKDPTNFRFAMQIMIGPLQGDGEESFQITICSPKWLMENIGSEVLMGRHYLLLNQYNFRKINSFLQQFINGIVGETWDEVAQKLSRLGYWEFEDYTKFENLPDSLENS